MRIMASLTQRICRKQRRYLRETNRARHKAGQPTSQIQANLTKATFLLKQQCNISKQMEAMPISQKIPIQPIIRIRRKILIM